MLNGQRALRPVDGSEGRVPKDGPAGMGVRFVNLDPSGKEALEEFVRVHKIRSFIPLG